jgi:NADPH2 dehydrogenase
MSEPFKLTRVAALKTVADFRAHVAALGLDLPCEDEIVAGGNSPLAQAIDGVTINGKRVGNRWAIHPMEGWDGTTTGGVTEEMLRRWQRFGESGAKLIYGGEAMAVRPGRSRESEPDHNHGREQAGIASLREILVKAHLRAVRQDGRSGHRLSTHALGAVLQAE